MKRKSIFAYFVLLICLALILTSCSGLIDRYIGDNEDFADGGDIGSNSTSGDQSSLSTPTDGENASQPGSAPESGATVPSTPPVVNNTVNNITITGTGGNVAYAAAQGLRSSVIVSCKFTSATTYTLGLPQTYYSYGSGVVYKLDSSGGAFIITNYHVVHDSSSSTYNKISDDITVYLYGMESASYAISATYVGGSANYDVAVLRIDESGVLANAVASGGIAAATVGNSDKVAPGQSTIVIGNPSGSGISVTAGIVSVESEYISMTTADNSGEVSFRVIRTDAPVNSGNSGGGMFNDRGELIGIVNAKIVRSDIENIGYAIPSNVARAIADNIIDYCYLKECESVMRGLLGVTVQSTAFTTSYDEETGLLTRSETVSIVGVTEGGLAYGLLLEGDIVKSITVSDMTVNITRQYHLIDTMLDVRVGDTVNMVVVRDGAELELGVVITEDCLVAY